MTGQASVLRIWRLAVAATVLAIAYAVPAGPAAAAALHVIPFP